MIRTEEQKLARKLRDNTPNGLMLRTISNWKLAPRRKYHNPLPLVCTPPEEPRDKYPEFCEELHREQQRKP